MNTPNGSRVFYSTSTEQANMRKTGKKGMLRVAASLADFKKCAHEGCTHNIRKSSVTGFCSMHQDSK